jgi:hypothetical protein
MTRQGSAIPFWSYPEKPGGRPFWKLNGQDLETGGETPP